MYDILIEQSQVTLQLAVLQQKSKQTSIFKIINLRDPYATKKVAKQEMNDGITA